MKMKFLTGLPAALFFIWFAFSCRKSVPTDSTNHTAREIPFPKTIVTGCLYAPDYGDTLIYPQPTDGSDYIVSPVNNPGIGKYFSWPGGLVIDSITGAINVTKSETGEKFDIGFVKSGTADTCLTTITLAGASYMDSVYVLANNETTALPYFNAKPLLTTAPQGSHFDITKSAYNQKVSINNNTGIIDLKNTLQAFGSSPVNGQTVLSTMYYTLNDGSNNALQSIKVQLMYYYSKSQINVGVLNNISAKRNNILAGNLIGTKGNQRPPLIIITRNN